MAKIDSLNIRMIERSDLPQWTELWKGYNTFYQRTLPEEITRTTWERFFNPNEPVYALVAEKNNQLLGLTHYIFHRNTTMINDTCYLQDLFTAESARNQGIAKALIEAVYKKAQENGSSRVYWQTHETNEVAMKLYDKIADYSGFVVYRKQITSSNK